MKICYKCKKEKELLCFYFDASRKDGHRSKCKECYKQINTKQINVLFKKCTKCLNLKSYEEYHKHKRTVDRLQDVCKTCRNLERRIRYFTNHAKEIFWSRAFKRNNPLVVKQQNERYRARKLNAEGSHSNKEWIQCKNDYDNKCVYCNKVTKLEKDHLIPLTKGGSDYITNIVPSCRSCNASKNNKLVNEFLRTKKINAEEFQRKLVTSYSISIGS